MSNKTIIVALVLLLLGSNLFWIFHAIDDGVTVTYMEASLDSLRDSQSAAITLANLNLIGLPADVALEKIRARVDASPVFEKPSENCIVVSQVCVQLDDSGRVSEIRD
ncbi:MAG: Imm58 family immunity protein [Gammaproteobacteria bacterium]